MNSNNTASRGLPTPLRVVIRNFSNAESKWVLLAYLDHHGNIVMEGYDVGPAVEEVWGDSDYEYWVTVGKEHKAKLAEALGVGLEHTSDSERDMAILNRIKERFTASSPYMKWLKERGIPYEFDSWA